MKLNLETYAARLLTWRACEQGARVLIYAGVAVIR